MTDIMQKWLWRGLYPYAMLSIRKTLPYLRNNSLDDFTYNKALQKIIESNRIDNDTKALIRSMKRR